MDVFNKQKQEIEAQINKGKDLTVQAKKKLEEQLKKIENMQKKAEKQFDELANMDPEAILKGGVQKAMGELEQLGKS